MKTVTSKILSLAFAIVTFIGFSATANAAKSADIARAKVLFIKTCSGCHGDNAEGMDGYAPKLSAQNSSVIIRAIKDFQQGKRFPEHKKEVAKMDRKLVKAMGEFLEGDGGDVSPLPAFKSKSGKDIPKFYRRKCSICHGENAEGTAFGPRLREQWSFYIEQEIANFGKGSRPIRYMNGHLNDLDQDKVLLGDLIKYFQAGASDK